MDGNVKEFVYIRAMKKILMFATAAFLFSGVAFGHGDKGKEKGKKKQKTHKTCPGKECGKKS
jgi:hypothetical protein